MCQSLQWLCDTSKDCLTFCVCFFFDRFISCKEPADELSTRPICQMLLGLVDNGHNFSASSIAILIKMPMLSI